MENANSCVNVLRKLLAVQTELKAPKGQYNAFGKYRYRNAEDILKGLKPLLAKNNCTILFNDEVITVGDPTITVTENSGTETQPNNYIKTTALFFDCDSGESITATAIAKESAHKGMSGDQCSGTASSYARKYCLNGMFLIDDGEDSDSLNTNENGGNSTPQNGNKPNKGWGSKPPANSPNNQPKPENKGWGNKQNNSPSQPAKQNTGWGKSANQNNEANTNNQATNTSQGWGKQNANNEPSQAPENESDSTASNEDFSDAASDVYPF